MATKDFYPDDTTHIIALGEATYNGSMRRIWEKRSLLKGCWVLQGRAFCPMKATRKEIIEQLG